MTNKQLELEHAKVEHLIDTITKPLYKRINELENIIDELKKELYHIYNYAGLETKYLEDKIKKLENGRSDK